MTKRVGPNIKMDRVGLETLVGGIAIIFAISVALTVAAMFPGTFTGSIAVGCWYLCSRNFCRWNVCSSSRRWLWCGWQRGGSGGRINRW